MANYEPPKTFRFHPFDETFDFIFHSSSATPLLSLLLSLLFWTLLSVVVAATLLMLYYYICYLPAYRPPPLRRIKCPQNAMA